MFYFFRQGCGVKLVQIFLKIFIVIVINKMDSFVVGGCIVYYFSYQYIIVVFIIEIEFIVNFDFMGRVNQDILKMGFVVEFVQEEYFDVCIGFFFLLYR